MVAQNHCSGMKQDICTHICGWDCPLPSSCRGLFVTPQHGGFKTHPKRKVSKKTHPCERISTRRKDPAKRGRLHWSGGKDVKNLCPLKKRLLFGTCTPSPRNIPCQYDAMSLPRNQQTTQLHDLDMSTHFSPQRKILAGAQQGMMNLEIALEEAKRTHLDENKSIVNTCRNFEETVWHPSLCQCAPTKSWSRHGNHCVSRHTHTHTHLVGSGFSRSKTVDPCTVG